MINYKTFYKDRGMRNLLLIATILLSFMASGQIVTTNSEKHDASMDVFETKFVMTDKVGEEGNRTTLYVVNFKTLSKHEDDVVPEDTVYENLLFVKFSSYARCSVGAGDKIYFKQANGNILCIESDKTYFCRYSPGTINHFNSVCYIIDDLFMKRIKESNVVEITLECSVSEYTHKITINPVDGTKVKQLFDSVNWFLKMSGQTSN